MGPNRIVSSIYGYGVCLIAIVVFLVSVAAFVSSAFRTADPALGAHRQRAVMRGFGGPQSFMHRGRFGEPGRYGHRRTYGSSGAPRGTRMNAAQGVSPTSSSSQRVIAFRNARIARDRLEAVRSLTISFVLIVVSVLLFLGHWRWLNAPQPA